MTQLEDSVPKWFWNTYTVFSFQQTSCTKMRCLRCCLNGPKRLTQNFFDLRVNTQKQQTNTGHFVEKCKIQWWKVQAVVVTKQQLHRCELMHRTFHYSLKEHVVFRSHTR